MYGSLELLYIHISLINFYNLRLLLEVFRVKQARNALNLE